MSRVRVLRFKPLPIGPWLLWGMAALLLVIAPLVFTQGFGRTLLSQMGVMVILALSYNLLLGQTGMLSFGHAVYSGLGAFAAIHALNAVAAGRLGLPVSLLPLVGGAAGAAVGLVLGWVMTRKAGTSFAMITLGVGEMVFAAALMFPEFFGGEGGVSGNRTAGPAGPFGWTLGPQIQVYYLIAAWCFVCMLAIYGITRTPLGRIANAVRDNPERAAFLGYNPRVVRWIMLMLSGFFAGIAGALTAIQFEIVSAENLSALRSGGMLLATFIGGIAFFVGPILGAIVFVFFAVALSEYTVAWQLYLGVFFILLVMYAPGGLASIVLLNLRVARFGLYRPLRDPLFGVLAAGATLAAGVILAVEMGYQLTLGLGQGSVTRVAGFAFDAATAPAWVIAAALLLAGGAAFEFYRREFKTRWDAAAAEIAAWQQAHPESAP